MSARGVFGWAVALGLVLGCQHEPPAAHAHLEERRGEAAIELVESAPVETTLDHADIPNAAEVWIAMIDHARETLDFAEFYASEAVAKDRAENKLEPVLASIERALKRGVRVRFLADSVFAPKYPETLDRLKSAGVNLRILDFGARGGGILHAKYFVVDSAAAFVGSQNFDWRALSHIQEMGVKVTSRAFAGALLDVFDTDWELAAGGVSDARTRRRSDVGGVRTRSGGGISLVASPRGWLPDESSWELPKLVAMIDRAAHAVDVQVLTYKTKDRDGRAFPMLDDALKRAATRGVRVRLLVSDWSAKPGSDARTALDDLAQRPNVEVRVITIPRFSGGEIPFARVAHAKYMVIDAAVPHLAQAWVGTSNWEGDYFTKSRNVGVIVRGDKLPGQLDSVFDNGWTSSYASPLARIGVVRRGDAGAARPSSIDPARP